MPLIRVIHSKYHIQHLPLETEQKNSYEQYAESLCQNAACRCNKDSWKIDLWDQKWLHSLLLSMVVKWWIMDQTVWWLRGQTLGYELPSVSHVAEIRLIRRQTQTSQVETDVSAWTRRTPLQDAFRFWVDYEYEYVESPTSWRHDIMTSHDVTMHVYS